MKVVLVEMPPLHFRVLCLAVEAAASSQSAGQSVADPRPSRACRADRDQLFNVAAWNVLAVYGVTFMESGEPRFSPTRSVWACCSAVGPARAGDGSRS